MNKKIKKYIVIISGILIILGLGFWIFKKYFSSSLDDLKYLEMPESYQVDILYAQGDEEHRYNGVYEGNGLIIKDEEANKTYNIGNVYESFKSYVASQQFSFGEVVEVTIPKDSFLSKNKIFTVSSDLDCLYYVTDYKLTQAECLSKNQEYFNFGFAY